MLAKLIKKNIQEKKSTVQILEFQDSIYGMTTYLGEKKFRFLNITKKFDTIDWNYSENGKLWTYNLTYFEFLSQENSEEFRYLIDDFIDNIEVIKDGLEPFPISLRGLNWIKYLIQYEIKDNKINNSLYSQYHLLMSRVEYHLLGNHLLENAFSLLFGAYYFQDKKFYAKSKKILLKELDEQILKDGAHFELSPMYHQLMLYRVLDCINLVKNNDWMNRELLGILTNKAEQMLGWIDIISYRDGSIPLLNDSANGIAPTTQELFAYAKKLELEIKDIELSESGYRKFINDNYEMIVDVGQIGPDYIPGHAHSDTFNFELYVHGKPFIVDTGLSTYENNAQRMSERSTMAHNTVQIENKEQSEVWGGFRVANRAKVLDLKESNNNIKATHDGYKKEKIYHTRKWMCLDNMIVIEDSINKKAETIARFHFHPIVTKEEILEKLIFKTNDFQISTYQYAPKFNTYVEAFLLEIKFEKNLKVEILLK